MEKANGTQTTTLSTTTQAIFASSWETSASREQARNFHGRSQEFARIELQISEKIPRKFKTKDNCQAKLTERC